MATWKKVIVSGSNAELNQVTASFFSGDGSALTNVPAGSVNIESFDDGTGITVATTDKLLVSDAGTEKYVNVNQVVSTALVTSAGALMDSEVDADIKTLSLPANTTISSFGKSLIDDAAASNARTTLGIGALSTAAAVTVDEMDETTLITSAESFEDSDDTKIPTVKAIIGANYLTAINNGNWSGTDLSVANGGTGASNASNARTNLGLAIGSDVQAYDAGLAAIAGLATTDGGFIVGNGTTFVLESGATVRTSLGLGSIATQASSNVSISGGSISGITDLAVADGGTGASNASGARTNLGLGSLATASEITVDEFNSTTLVISTDTFEDTDDTKIPTVRAIVGAGYLTSINNGNWSGADLAVANGGTGASNASDARTNLGLGSLATLSSVNNSNFSGTDLSIANGGTGQSTAAAAANALLNTSQGGALTIGDSSDTITISGNLTVSGTTTTVSTDNLAVKDQFIQLNNGNSAADSGIVVEGQGAAFAWDESENRWGYDFTGADGSNNSVTFDAYAVTVESGAETITGVSGNYTKNGNMYIDTSNGDIFIYS